MTVFTETTALLALLLGGCDDGMSSEGTDADADGWTADPRWQQELARHAEGHQTTLGPYHRSWH